MSNTYSNLKFEIIEVGGNDGTWGPIVNTNVGTAIEQAIVGMATLVTGDFTSNVATLTLTNTNAAQNARAACLNITATLSAAGTVNVPAIEKPYIVINNSVGGYAVTVKVSGLTGVSIPNGKACIVYNNGTDVVSAITYLASLTLGTDLAVTEGGTGASTASGARTNLGATTLGANLFTITNPSAVTFPQFNADNTVSALDAASFRTAIGAGTGGGSVSSVAVSGGTTGLTTSGGPITSSGTITLAGTLAVANGGTGVTTSTGSGNVVLSTSPTLVTPALGTPSSGTLSNCTVDGTYEVGYKIIPQNSESVDYTLVLADSGKHIYHPSTDANSRTFTIPANASVAYPVGTAISFVNMSANSITIAITSDTMYSSTGSTGSRTLAQYGSATALKMTSTTWLITGSNLT